MFRITEDPSSRSLVQCLTKKCKNCSIISVDMNKVGVMAAYCDPLCVCVAPCVYIYSGAKRTHFFSNNFNFFIFNIKKMLTPKQPVINAVLITYIDYSVTENYIGKVASFLPYTLPEPLLKVLHHIY